ncbi:coiled-coil domain containing related [Cystoisospora suis]|uniref:Splicing factor YJU2 n=1 Tax=Cystoisospora suis TaxID=483139 RepID=A0A2C6KPX4_9APIC|nr:coiled-coil domain containing related [Cystoisospora suis]
MADRKVLVKYYPPDFDFEVLQKKKRVLNKAKELQYGKKRRQTGMSRIMNVRMMFPFTLQCASCREFVYVGTKFNSRVERVQGEDYLGIAKWRFYGRCPNCRGEICFKTDPKNGDYVLEWGGTRTYDPMKDQQLAEERLRKKREEELEGDRMKQVEAKTYNVQSELAAMEQLEELRKMNRRLVDREAATEHALQFLKQNEVSKEAGEDWDDYERTELMRFMETQRELRQREEGESDDDEGVEEAEHRSGDTSSPLTRSDVPSAARASRSSSSGDSAVPPVDRRGGSSPSAKSSRSDSSGPGRRSEEGSPRISRLHTNDCSASCEQQEHLSGERASKQSGARTTIPGSSAASRSMFMLTAVTGCVPKFIVKKKDESESVSDMFVGYASSPSSEEEKDAEERETKVEQKVV